jgi:hypothetical protein
MTIEITTLITSSPEEGYMLAIRLSRTAIKLTQPDAQVRNEVRGHYERDAMALTAIAQTVAIHFATVAGANDYWKDRKS